MQGLFLQFASCNSTRFDVQFCSSSSLSDWGLRLIAANDFGGCGGAGRWGWEQKAIEGAGDRRFLGTCLPSRRTSALSGRDEGEHPLDVPDHGDETPFTDRRSSSAALRNLSSARAATSQASSIRPRRTNANFG